MMTFNFALVAIDQIVNHAAKILYMSGGQYRVPMVIRGPAVRPSRWPRNTLRVWSHTSITCRA